MMISKVIISEIIKQLVKHFTNIYMYTYFVSLLGLNLSVRMSVLFQFYL